MFSQQNAETDVPLYKIPNIILGRADKQRQQTLVFFPGLVDPARDGTKLTPTEIAEWYDRCLYPTLKRVVSTRMAHWPSTYELAEARSRDRNGRLHFSSESIPQHTLAEFAEMLQWQAERMDWGDIFFVHELRGVKNQSEHDAGVEGGAVDSWDSCLEFLDVDKIEQEDPTGREQWYIDVALEVTAKDGQHVLQWYEGSREQLLRIGLPNATDAQVRALAKSEKRTHVDTVAQLYAFAGVRSSPGKNMERRDQVKYLNIYTTDKEITYTAHHDGPYSRHWPNGLFPERVAKLLSDVHVQTNTFRKSGGYRDEWEGWCDVQSGGARYEVRVALCVGQAALSEVTIERLRPHFACVLGPAWW